MRKFKGQRLSKEKDFFTHESNFDHLTPYPNTFHITLGDIPKDELLATAAAIKEDTFYKLGLRNHTVKRPNSRRVVSCTPAIQQTTDLAYTSLLPPPLPKRTSLLNNTITRSEYTTQRRIVTLNDSSLENKFGLLPQRVITHDNKLSLEDDFVEKQQKGHNSSESLLQEILETYSQICDLNIDAVPHESVPDLVNCLSDSNSSIDTTSQFSFEQEIDDNEVIRKSSHNLFKSKVVSDKPLPPIPVKKLSQSSYRNYDLKTEKTISLDPQLLCSRRSSKLTKSLPQNENEYILSRTGGDNFKSVLRSEQVEQDENDLNKFTRKCSTSSSKYSSSSEEHFTAPSTPVSGSLHFEDVLQEMYTAPSSPNMNLYAKNPYSPKAYKRNLTPINEKNGYEENKTTLCVIND